MQIPMGICLYIFKTIGHVQAVVSIAKEFVETGISLFVTIKIKGTILKGQPYNGEE